MDPTATYQLWRDAVRRNDDEMAAQYRRDLIDWLDRGGFEPAWTQAQKVAFYLVLP